MIIYFFFLYTNQVFIFLQKKKKLVKNDLIKIKRRG